MVVGIVATPGDRRRTPLADVPGVRFAGRFDVERQPAEGAGFERWLDGLDVIFVGEPTGTHVQVAERAARRGVHLFLEWPPAASLGEAETIARLAEEAGVEVGVSRPLRYHADLTGRPAGWTPSIVLFRATLAAERPPWRRVLADAVDVACDLAGSGSVQRVEAEVARRDGPWAEAVAVGLRFHNGTYAQLALRAGATPERHLYAAGAGHVLESPLGGSAPARLAREGDAFLAALAARRHAPVSIHEALDTLRLVERLMERLR